MRSFFSDPNSQRKSADLVVRGGRLILFKAGPIADRDLGGGSGAVRGLVGGLPERGPTFTGTMVGRVIGTI